MMFLISTLDIIVLNLYNALDFVLNIPDIILYIPYCFSTLILSHNVGY